MILVAAAFVLSPVQDAKFHKIHFMYCCGVCHSLQRMRVMTISASLSLVLWEGKWWHKQQFLYVALLLIPIIIPVRQNNLLEDNVMFMILYAHTVICKQAWLEEDARIKQVEQQNVEGRDIISGSCASSVVCQLAEMGMQDFLLHA